MKKSALGFLLGLFLSLTLTALAGENPWHILKILLQSAFGTRYDLGLTLFYTTPLIFTGLSVAWAYRSGLFNIGAEGQLVMGTLSLSLLALAFPGVSQPVALLMGLIVPLLGGGLWGLFAGWMKSRRGAHEVIVTMMMNFIAAGVASYFILQVIPNPQSQNPESALLVKQYLFKNFDFVSGFFPETPVSLALVLAILCAVVSYIIFEKSVFGYRMKVVGQNPQAAERAGMSKNKIQMLSMFIAGAMAGAVAWAEVLGSSGQYKLNFSPDYGFLGIAVALMAANHPLGILLSAFLIGALHKGAADLDMETATITRDFSKVLQAMIVLFVSAPHLWDFLKRTKFFTGFRAKERASHD